MKSGMMSSGISTYAPTAARMSFCSAGTRGSRRRSHASRAYAGSCLTSSMASPRSAGPLRTLHLPFGESRPHRRDGRTEGLVPVAAPHRHLVPRRPLGDPAEEHRGGWLLGDEVGPAERVPQALGHVGGQLVGVHRDGEPGAAVRIPREVHDRRRHERRVRDNDLPAVVGPKLRGAERDLLDDPDVPAVDLHGVADAERSLHEDIDPGGEALQDVQEREAHDEAEHAEGAEDPAKGVARVDGQDDQGGEDEHDELADVPKKGRHVRMGPRARERAYHDAPDRPRDRDGDDDDQQRPEGPDQVLDEEGTVGLEVKGHGRRIGTGGPGLDERTSVRYRRSVTKQDKRRAERILEFIRSAVAERGYPPSVREIAEAVGLASTSAVHHHLTKLEREGKLHKTATRSRALTVPDTLGGRAVRAPIIGEIAAGSPIYAYPDQSESLSVPAELTG